jgi:two-component system NtrC family sensor kinase
VAGEKILVIDDSAEIRTFLGDDILGPEGYSVISARDGQEGLLRALRERPDLILLDVNMPRMTGMQVLEKLRDARYEWPVILMTFHGSENVAVQAFRLGVRDYIRKPFEAEEVLASVDRALVEAKLRREREELLKRLEASNQLLNRKVTELATLYAIGQAVTSLLDLEKLLNRVVEASVYLCRADEGMLYLIDEKSGQLYMTAAQSMGERAARGLRLRVSDQLAQQVIQTGQPAIVTSETLGTMQKIKTGYLVHSLLDVPLKVKDRVIGVLSVVNRTRARNFARDDMTRLSAMANYAAIAIDNARLYQATRRLVTAEVLNDTVVTISHYVNNPLTTLMVNADRLTQAKKEGKIADGDDLIAQATRLTEMKVEEISAVLAILHDLASPQFVTYVDDIKMLDIEAKVRERLQFIKEKYKV